MAIDTRDKRSSAIHVSLPWRGLLPLPDGSLNQGDRQHTAYMYRGILASSGTPAPVGTPKFEGFRRNVGRLMR